MTGSDERPTVLILGCRGVPAAHGGFETFAERLSLFLVARGWRVVVYCQHDGAQGPRFRTDTWQAIERVHVAARRDGPLGTLEFDWHATRHAARLKGACLVLGYNTALFLPLLRGTGHAILTNMDGIEWQRPKWSRPVRAWFYVNEQIAARVSHRLVADHPVIADHLASRRSRDAIVTIPYGGDPVRRASKEPIGRLGLEPGRYLVSVARIEPDNNVLSIVRAFSRRRRSSKLVVLGRVDETNAYHRAVREAASDEVVFPGAIYDPETVRALRFHARAYCHGHSVGGTNPSLVEALWCGNAVLAHKNAFNIWTAGHDQFFFSTEDECERWMDHILTDDLAVERAGRAARRRAAADFGWRTILETYERELATLGGYRLDPSRTVPAEDIVDVRLAAE